MLRVVSTLAVLLTLFCQLPCLRAPVNQVWRSPCDCCHRMPEAPPADKCEHEASCFCSGAVLNQTSYWLDWLPQFWAEALAVSTVAPRGDFFTAPGSLMLPADGPTAVISGGALRALHQSFLI